jgi:hypothetical protein
MGVMSDEERMDAVLRQMAAEEYNRPPHIVPREQMWDAIQQGLGTGDKGLGAGRFGVSRLGRVPRWVYLAVAAALLLAVGMQLGRMTSTVAPDKQFAQDSSGVGLTSDRPIVVPPGQEQVVVIDPRSDDGKGPRPPRPRPEPERAPSELAEGADRAYNLVAAQHLTQAEALLTAFKGDLNQGRMDTQMASWGKELLSNTRLLLDSPVATDPVRRKLLQDLELVLVQIVQLSPNASARDRDLIRGALTDDEVLTRLRTAIPAQKGT